MGPAYRTMAGMILCLFFAVALMILAGLAYAFNSWQKLVLVTSLPACEPLHHLELDCVSPLYECQQIRSYKSTAVILFTEKKMEQVIFIWEGFFKRFLEGIFGEIFINGQIVFLNLARCCGV